jgi:hypothetical protein
LCCPSPPGSVGVARPRILDGMRITHFRRRMTEEFGAVRAEMIARDHVFSALGGSTVDQALAGGQPIKKIWTAVCEDFDVPEGRR